MTTRRVALLLLVALLPMAAFAAPVQEVEPVTIEVPVEVPVEVEVFVEVPSFPLEADFPDVPADIGMIRPDAAERLSLEQQAVLTSAFKRVYQEHVYAEFNPGQTLGGDLLHFWEGRDPASVMVSQNVGVEGDGTGEGWGIPGLIIIAASPTATQAFIIADEFLAKYSAGRDDEYGGNGPDGFGYPISDVYYTDIYKAQAFSKGLMIVEEGMTEAEFIPGPIELDEIPELVGSPREDAQELYTDNQLAALTEAFVREYKQARIREFDPGVPYGGDLLHEWHRRDGSPTVTQNFMGDSASDGNLWGMPGLAIMMMDPSGRRAFLIKDEFLIQYSTGRDDEWGGNGPDGYGAPITNEYKRFGYRAQAFEFGLMILEDGEMEFIPNAE